MAVSFSGLFVVTVTYKIKKASFVSYLTIYLLKRGFHFLSRIHVLEIPNMRYQSPPIE